ncbi:hypothetical protein PC118_g23643, partial [Phytophthora cactorum]
NQLAIAAADESSILENLEIEHQFYFFAITDTIRKISDPQDTCTYSSRCLAHSREVVATWWKPYMY